jgi:cytochrome c-type biogenesis protein CcmH
VVIWIVLIGLALAATVAMFFPVWRRNHGGPSRDSFDAQIYRDQLEEVEADSEAGRISADQAASARTEIARRLLAISASADDHTTEEASASFQGGRRGIATILAVALPVASFGVYMAVGSPNLPGRPAAEVKAEMSPAEVENNALLARVAEQLLTRPNDLRGWTLYARSLVRARRFGEAVTAYQRVTELAPKDAELRSRLAEAQIFAANGAVTPMARQTLDATLEIEPGEPRARFYLGLAESQAGKPESALSIWIALEADSRPDAPWRTILDERIAKLAAQSHMTADQLAARRQAAKDSAKNATASGDQLAKGPRGPTADDVKAAQSMSTQDRMEMIRGMVAGLAERLKDQPDDIQGWQRLARSYGVLGETQKAREAYAHLAEKQPNDVGVLTAYASAIARTLPSNNAIPAELSALGDRILALDSNHTGALWFTGMARAQAGDPAGARERWTRLLTLLDPKSPQYADVAKNLKALGNAPNQ